MNVFGFARLDIVQGLFFALLLGVFFGYVFGLVRYIIFGALERQTA